MKAPKGIPEVILVLVLLGLGGVGTYQLMRLYVNEGGGPVVFVVGIFVLVSLVFCSLLWIPEPSRSRSGGSSGGDSGSLDFGADSSDGGGDGGD